MWFQTYLRLIPNIEVLSVLNNLKIANVISQQTSNLPTARDNTSVDAVLQDCVVDITVTIRYYMKSDFV